MVTREKFARLCVLVALVSWALFAILGMYVARNGEPAALAALQQSLVNHATLIAWWLTWSCYVQVIGPIAIVLLIVAFMVTAWRTRILFSIVMLLLSWRAADFLQHYFARLRPIDWVVKHETAFSYPSSHAAIAFGFYALWAVMIYWSDLPARRTARRGALACRLDRRDLLVAPGAGRALRHRPRRRAPCWRSGWWPPAWPWCRSRLFALRGGRRAGRIGRI